MAWDATRPVPWRRLIRDWLLYVGIMTAVFLIVFRDRLSAGLFTGLLVSGPLFVAVGAVLAKFGYQRKTLRDLRAESSARSTATTATTAGTASRPKPAPTKRTSTGPSRSSGSKRKR